MLFADDETSLQQLMKNEIPRMGHEVTVCPNGLTAVAAMQRNAFDCVLVDLDMPDINGIEVIARTGELCPEAETVVLTGKSSLESAVAALRHGAFDYLTKPYKLVEIDALLRRIAEKLALRNRCRALKRQLDRVEGSSRLVGSSRAMQHVGNLISKVAPTHSNVLVLGETGTGKELVARALHDQSLRAEKPFVAVNCGALPESLIESELFGHRKGAFTGADEHRTGLFEVADGGTLFLDEIGELPRAMQAKLLRFLESGEIRRVGENQAFQVDVRVVCATHRNLEQMVSEDEFREDLMFRINTFEIRLAPLRERLEDIAELAAHLAARLRGGAPSKQSLLSDEAIEILKQHVWPGNVRELANVIEHATILSGGESITVDDLPPNFDRRRMKGPQFKLLVPQTLREVERQVIQQVLERHGGHKPKAAAELGISLKTLYNKLNQAEALKESA